MYIKKLIKKFGKLITTFHIYKKIFFIVFKRRFKMWVILVFFLIFLIRIFFIRTFFIRIFSIRIRRNFYIVNNMLKNLFFFNNIFCILLKTLVDNNIRSFWNQNRLKLLLKNILRIFFWYFIVVEICVDFSIIGFF